jgi:hypothetical protein
MPPDIGHLIHGFLGLLLLLLALFWLEQSRIRSHTISWNKSEVVDLPRLQGRHEVEVFPSGRGGKGIPKRHGEVYSCLLLDVYIIYCTFPIY